MYKKQINIVFVVLVVCVVGTLYASSQVKVLSNVAKCNPAGTWVVTLNGVSHFTVSVVEPDREEKQLTWFFELADIDPFIFPEFSGVDEIKSFTGTSQKTGIGTYDSTAIGYGINNIDFVENEMNEIEAVRLYEKSFIVVLSTKKRFTDCNTFTAEGTLAFYFPHQDVNGDGFPESDESPARCIPITLVGKRLGIIPQCDLSL